MPTHPSQRILFRIIIPFTLLFIFISVSSWLFSIHLIRRYIDEDLRQQMERVTKVISQSSYVLNPIIFRQMKSVVNSEIILFNDKGQVLNTTINEIGEEHLLQKIAYSMETDNEENKIVDLHGISYKMAVQPLIVSGHGKSFLSLLVPVKEKEQLQRQIFQATGWLALLGILFMLILSYMITKTITNPIEELVMVSGKVAGGDFTQQAVIRKNDEVGCLAKAFNLMITQLLASEKRLVESEKMATAGQMAASLAHEIRNPLTSIKMFVQVLAARLTEQPDNQNMVASLLQEICRLEHTINRIVESTRPGDLQMRPGNIQKDLKEILNIATPNFQSSDITFDCNIETKLPEVVYDSEMLKQVFWNILLNCKDAMPQGGKIHISTSKVSDGLDIVISDNGSGLADKDPEIFFNAFYTTKPEGMGMGLFTSRKIIEKHGGTLSLVNGPDGGAVTTIHLPMEEKNNEYNSGCR